jgi:hypothetical protein
MYDEPTDGGLDNSLTWFKGITKSFRDNYALENTINELAGYLVLGGHNSNTLVLGE